MCCSVGPPGLGKTTLAQIVARELGVGFRATSGPVIQRAGDLAAMLTNLQPRDVLFIDEIHRLKPAVEEILYPAMEDFQLDLIIGEGPAARSVRIDLPPFTLVGATTRSGLITPPLRERFGIPLRLVFYEPEELERIVRRGAGVLGMALDRRRRRGDRAPLARHAARRRRACCAACAISPPSTASTRDRCARRRRRAQPARGRRPRPRRHGPPLSALHRRELRRRPGRRRDHGRGARRQRDVIEEVIEPYLIQQGLLQRTPRGRMLTDHAYTYLGLPSRRGAHGAARPAGARCASASADETAP